VGKKTPPRAVTRGGIDELEADWLDGRPTSYTKGILIMLIERVTPFLLVWVLRGTVLLKEWAHLISEMLSAEPWWFHANLFLLIFVLYTLVACKETVEEFNHMVATLLRDRLYLMRDVPPPCDTNHSDENSN